MEAPESRTIQVYADAEEAVHCMRCQSVLHGKQIAMLVRTSPKDGFHAWCPGCTWWIMHNALNGLDVPDEGVAVIMF